MAWPAAGSAHGLSVGAVGSELEGDGAEHAQLGGHLLHPAETSLLLRVSELHHQAGRGTLRTGATPRSEGQRWVSPHRARGTWLRPTTQVWPGLFGRAAAIVPLSNGEILIPPSLFARLCRRL